MLNCQMIFEIVLEKYIYTEWKKIGYNQKNCEGASCIIQIQEIPRKKVEKKIPQSKIRLLTLAVSKNLIEQRGI